MNKKKLDKEIIEEAIRITREKQKALPAYNENVADLLELVRIEQPLKCKDNNVMIASDYHIPFQNDTWINYMYKIAKEHNINTLIIGGDFWDATGLSPFVPEWGTRLTFQDEIRFAAVKLRETLRHFKRVFIITGNHERRFTKMSNKTYKVFLDTKDLFCLTEVVGNYTVTSNNYMMLLSGDKVWRITHPHEYSRIPLTVARKLSDKYRCSIANAHGHLFSTGWNMSRSDRLVDLGGLFNADVIPYTNQVNTYPVWENGFVIVRDGHDVLSFDELPKKYRNM